MAVGQASEQPLAEVWEGSAWASQALASNASFGQLSGISCATPTNCIAVGQSGLSALIESWNGSQWQAQRTAPNGGSLNGVSCTAHGTCLAVGETANASQTRQWPLADIWNRSSWTEVFPFGKRQGSLSGVSCTRNACTITGEFGPTTLYAPLAGTWNGSTFSLDTPASAHGVYNGSLNAISCTALGCTAVGNATPFGPLDHSVPFAEHQS